MEPGQDRKVAALTLIFMCTFFIGDYMNDIYFMKEALKEANKAFNCGEVPIGAVIVKDNKVIARAYNLKESKNNATNHAEIMAINKASKKLDNWRLIDCTMYVTMFPCPMCASAINQARISRVIYGTIPEYANESLINDILNDNKYGIPVDIEGGILQAECTELLKKFFSKKR